MNELEGESFAISMHFGYDWPGRIFMSLAVQLTHDLFYKRDLDKMAAKDHSIT